jgi:hypothetical protein
LHWQACFTSLKAEAYKGYCGLVALQTVFGQQAEKNGNDQFNRIASVLQLLIETESRQFESAAVADEGIDLKLFSEGDDI